MLQHTLPPSPATPWATGQPSINNYVRGCPYLRVLTYLLSYLLTYLLTYQLTTKWCYWYSTMTVVLSLLL